MAAFYCVLSALLRMGTASSWEESFKFHNMYSLSFTAASFLMIKTLDHSTKLFRYMLHLFQYLFVAMITEAGIIKSPKVIFIQIT